MKNKQTTPQNVSPASHAASLYTAGVGVGVFTAMKLADNQPTESDENKKRYGDMVTQHTPTNGRFYLPGGYTRTCNHCGQEYTAKRDTSKFCSRRCRVNAHRAKHGQGGQS